MVVFGSLMRLEDRALRLFRAADRVTGAAI
jgi:hypothetical protein